MRPILVVDDDASICSIIRVWLRSQPPDFLRMRLDPGAACSPATLLNAIDDRLREFGPPCKEAVAVPFRIDRAQPDLLVVPTSGFTEDLDGEHTGG
jgi:hypothetical protein